MIRAVPRRAAQAPAAAVVTAPLAPVALLIVPLVLLLLAAAPAHASAYRYWSFWHWSGGSWGYQQQGPATNLPADGSVDGWRFTLSPDGGRDTARPAAAGDFAALCAAVPARPGFKRVGLVLDFGGAGDAPSGEAAPAARTGCAQVRVEASSAEVLAAVAPPLRYDTNGMLCAIAGYPAAGCGEVVSGPGAGSGSDSAGSTAAGAAKAADGGPDLGLPLGAALVALLGVGALWQVRRRRPRP
ncbi:SCO2322 family protein [Kitasatospora nipponensis]|uniref:SCO2322 family protein n=1 Tax=Kitasatospora nipponensis TaxID=258049 RepID=A0ABN1WRU7_9ACTN